MKGNHSGTFDTGHPRLEVDDKLARQAMTRVVNTMMLAPAPSAHAAGANQHHSNGAGRRAGNNRATPGQQWRPQPHRMQPPVAGAPRHFGHNPTGTPGNHPGSPGNYPGNPGGPSGNSGNPGHPGNPGGNHHGPQRFTGNPAQAAHEPCRNAATGKPCAFHPCPFRH